MLHLHRKHRKYSKGTQLVVVRLFAAIALAALDTVWSLYMDSFGLSESAIGYISASLVVVSFGFAAVATPILEYFKQTRILVASLVVSIFGYLTIGLFQSLTVFLVVAVILTIAAVLRIACFDLLFRDATKDTQLNKQEGLLYAIINIGWLLGPLIAGILLIWFGLSSIFMLAAALFAVSLFLFLAMHMKSFDKKRKKYDRNLFENAKSFLRNRKLRLPYLMVMGIEVWWALVYIYIPLFMIKNGLTESAVGLFMAAIIVPLVLIEYKVGKSSAKRGFRYFFVLGFFGLSVLSFILFFTHDIVLQLVLVAIGSIFMSFLEPIQDTFFFKQINKKEEEKYYPLFSTAGQAGSFFGKVVIASVLLILPSNFAYLVTGVLMACFMVLAMMISSTQK